MVSLRAGDEIEAEQKESLVEQGELRSESNEGRSELAELML
jgi:hypothetical protein